jgi:4-amino-4-deoxychorismate lyase
MTPIGDMRELLLVTADRTPRLYPGKLSCLIERWRVILAEKTIEFDGEKGSTHAPTSINAQPSSQCRMKFFENSSSYDYSFPAVTLAYFLRYPNPYSRHVLCTDVIDRYVDPSTKRLHTTRLHLKRSKVPAAMLKFIPAGLAGPGGASQSYVIEKSVIDVDEGWMETESRNMEWTGILSVSERQTFRRQPIPTETWRDKLAATNEDMTANAMEKDKEWTSCKTVVSFKSRLGQAMRKNAEISSSSSSSSEDDVPKQGFLASWSTAGIQRTIELIGVKRTKTAIMNGRNGMNVVLERLRNGGVVGVLEGMRNDRMEMMGGKERPWKRAWIHGNQSGESQPTRPDHLDHDR